MSIDTPTIIQMSENCLNSMAELQIGCSRIIYKWCKFTLQARRWWNLRECICTHIQRWKIIVRKRRCPAASQPRSENLRSVNKDEYDGSAEGVRKDASSCMVGTKEMGTWWQRYPRHSISDTFYKYLSQFQLWRIRGEPPVHNQQTCWKRKLTYHPHYQWIQKVLSWTVAVPQ